MSRSPLSSSPPYILSSQWFYQPLTSGSESPFLCHLETLKAQWTAEKIELPEVWMNLSKPIFVQERCLQAVKALHRIDDMISPLTMDEQEYRAMDFISPQPDFILATTDHEDPDPPFETSGYMSTILNLLRLVNIIFLSPTDEFSFPRSRKSAASDMALVLQKFLEMLPGFMLKTGVSNGFADAGDHDEKIDFALLVRQYGSKWEPRFQRYRDATDPICYSQQRAIALSLRISDTHPAVIMGIIDEGRPGAEPALHRLARLIRPSLDAVLKTWRLRQQQCGESLGPPPWLIVFGLVITADTVTIVAHYAVENGSHIKFGSCVVDKFPYHWEICWQKPPSWPMNFDNMAPERWEGPVDDNVWIRDRLRLFIALLTIMKVVRRVGAIWDDTDWSAQYFSAEDALEKRHAKWETPTPNPSDGLPDPDANPFRFNSYDKMYWETEWIAEDSSDTEADHEKEQRNREKILAWRQKIQLS